MADRNNFLRVTIESCEVMDVVAPTGGVEAGEMTVVSDVVGVYVEAGDAGDTKAFITRADGILVPKATGTGTAIAQGDKVYFDTAVTTGVGGVTEDPTGNALCGYCKEAATTTDAVVLISLDGTLEIVA